MRETFIKEYCHHLYGAWNIPIHYYDENNHLVAEVPKNLNFFSELLEDFPHDKSIAFFTDTLCLCWGCVRDLKSNSVLLVGPVSSVPVGTQQVHAFMKEHIIPLHNFEEIDQMFSYLPKIPYQRLLYILSLIHFQLNGKLIPGEKLLNDFNSEIHTNNMNPTYEPLTNNMDDSNSEINTFSYANQEEQNLLYYIEIGDLDKIRELSTSPLISMCYLADTPIRSYKNQCIVALATVSRFAIRKGLDGNTSCQLCNLYIRAIENSQTLNALISTINSAYFEFSNRLQQLRMPAGVSPLIHKCMQYIRQEILTPITVADVASYVKKSPAYLSTTFKSELGFNMNSYISRCKIEEAKSLLENTDKSISDISYYLCYSSQSYFHRVFQKVTGTTPVEYRNNHKFY